MTESKTYEQWFSNERMSGKSVTLNAVSAIASNTSYKAHRHRHHLQEHDTRAIPKVSSLDILDNIFHNLYISETYIL